MKKCLIVVDFQNDFVDGSLGFNDAKKLEPMIVKKIEDAIISGVEIVFTLDTHFEDYLQTEEGKNLPIVHCVKGTKGHELYGRTSNYLTIARKVIEKHTFGSLELADVLKERAYDEVELCGLVSNICVLSNAVIAKTALPNARIIVDRNATASSNFDLHKKSLEVMKGFQVEIVGQDGKK